MDIQDKTIFITGGASGIGLETAKKLLVQGAKVAVYSLNAQRDKLENELGGLSDGQNILIIAGDVTKREEVRAAMESVVEAFGGLDVLINNAGVAKRENFLDTDEKDWDFILDVNVKGVFICIQEFVKINRRSSGRERLVINIASGAGIYGVDEIAVYSASKAAVINLSQSLNEELKNTGVKFFSVAPGATETKMFDAIFIGEKALNTPDQIAEVIYKSIIGETKPDDRLVVDVFRHITKI